MKKGFCWRMRSEGTIDREGCRRKEKFQSPVKDCSGFKVQYAALLGCKNNQNRHNPDEILAETGDKFSKFNANVHIFQIYCNNLVDKNILSVRTSF